MRERDYAYAVARIRALETRLLDNAQLERIANTPNFSEALTLLGETEYNGFLADSNESGNFETSLDVELNRVIRLLSSLAQDAPEFNVFLYRYDIGNLKKILKSENPVNVHLSNFGVWSHDKLLEIATGSTVKDVPAAFQVAITEARHSFKETGDVQEIERILDRTWFDYGYHVLHEGISSLLFTWWIAFIDLTNLRTFIRLRLIGLPFTEYERFFISNGQLTLVDFRALWDQSEDKIITWLSMTGYSRLIAEDSHLLTSLTVLEREYDNYLTDIISKAKLISLGIEPLVGYLIAKEVEIRTLRIILVGKTNGVPTLQLKERLRRAYA